MLSSLQISLRIRIFLLCIVATSVAFATTITVSGPTQVCPNQSYTYSASASNTFGSVPGIFQFTFYKNGVIVGHTGNLDCTSTNLTTSASAAVTWPNELGAVQVKVDFRDLGCGLTSTVYYNANISVWTPGQISGLLFCSSGQTQIVSIPGIPFNTAAACFYHYKYDWILPAGWTAVPADGNGYETITGGIRSFATSIYLTAPASTLATGYTGNYNVTVQSEPLWPFPVSSTGKIWVGAPTITGPTRVGPCGDETYNYSATLVTGATYTWTFNNPNLLGQPQESTFSIDAGDAVPGGNPFTLGVSMHYGGCTLTTSKTGSYIKKTPDQCSGSGGGGQLISLNVYPNPTADQLRIESMSVDGEEALVQDETMPEDFSAKLLDANGQVRKAGTSRGGKLSLDTHDLARGIYYLHLKRGDQTTREQIVIDK
ncbi:MAG TPA: T9SS type A sorting domain-containing protein [Chryseolinea sp.]